MMDSPSGLNYHWKSSSDIIYVWNMENKNISKYIINDVKSFIEIVTKIDKEWYVEENVYLSISFYKVLLNFYISRRLQRFEHA